MDLKHITSAVSALTTIRALCQAADEPVMAGATLDAINGAAVLGLHAESLKHLAHNEASGVKDPRLLLSVAEFEELIDEVARGRAGEVTTADQGQQLERLLAILRPPKPATVSELAGMLEQILRHAEGNRAFEDTGRALPGLARGLLARVPK